MKPHTIITLCALLVASVAFSAEPAWEQHGKLKVSANGHRIQHADGTPFLWIGDTA